MSDPQTNIEIEDVLASIRRLVSEGEAPTGAGNVVKAPLKPDSKPVTALEVPVNAPETTANSPSAPERLVLRADQMLPSAPKQETPPSPAPLLLTPAVKADDTSAEQARTDLLADNNSHDTTDLGSFVAPKPPSEPLKLSDPIQQDPTDMWHSAALAKPDPVKSDDKPQEDGAIDARARLLSTIADLEAAVGDTSDDFEPDGSETTPVIDWAKTTANGSIFGSRAATTRIADVVKSVPTPRDAPQLPNSPLAAVTTEDTPSTTEALVAEAVLAAEADTLVANIDDDLSQYLAAETSLDEDALREMVRDIVHQELRGALGERITRNVRKLVRREIYRVLSSEEFS